MEENILNDSLKEKVNALGSDTIMGTMAAVNNTEEKEKLEKLSEAVEENKEANPVTIDGNTIEAMQRAGYFRKTRPIVRDNKKIGRNDPCPCGSGKKYKNCCLDSKRFETTHYE